MPTIRISGRFAEKETRDVSLTADQYAALQARELDPEDVLWGAWGEAVDFVTESLDDVVFELIDERGRVLIENE